MLGHVRYDIFQAATPNTSKSFRVSGDAKAFGGSVYAPGATAAKLQFSFDGGTNWVDHATALTAPASGFFAWSASYVTYPLARVAVTAGTATQMQVYIPE